MAPPTLKLNSGHHMPQVGFGLWKVDNPTCADTVYNAIKTGYRLLDGACGSSYLLSLVSDKQADSTLSQITATKRKQAKA
jgi:diketogulonate reductase-like aldo/keto reductase